MLHFKSIVSKININFKTLGKILLLGVIIQIAFFLKYSYHSFNFLSGLLFLFVLWYLTFIIVKHKSLKIKLIVNSIFISLLIIEILLRITGLNANYMEKRLGFYESAYHFAYPNYWIHRDMKEIQTPNQDYNFKRKFNSLGYSDKEWKWEAMKDKTRILALGDSFTEGDGTHADSTWLKFLERKINKSIYYFMNAGICGSDPVFELYKLKKPLKGFYPNIVIVCINQSDIQDIIMRGGYERFTDKGVTFEKGPWWEPIYAMSHLSRLFFHIHYNKLLIPKKHYTKEINTSIETINKTITEIENFVSSHSAKLVVVFHPQKTEVKQNENPFKRLIKKQNQKGVYIIDLYDYYQTPEIKNNIDDYYWIKDGHHNAKGYELMAEGIYQGLIELELYHEDSSKNKTN
ncbi:MAG: SGNH/GDSL hydrolase family protein [Bacteroidota bacterium]|nr:SGNH/GDSL hydrolase family protein [Bacteroidota bacterium]